MNKKTAYAVQAAGTWIMPVFVVLPLYATTVAKNEDTTLLQRGYYNCFGIRWIFTHIHQLSEAQN